MGQKSILKTKIIEEALAGDLLDCFKALSYAGGDFCFSNWEELSTDARQALKQQARALLQKYDISPKMFDTK